MNLSKIQEIKSHSDTNWKIQLIYMEVHVNCSSELPLEHKENRPLSNQNWLWPYLINLRALPNQPIMQFQLSSRRKNR